MSHATFVNKGRVATSLEGFCTFVLFPHAEGDKGSSHDCGDKIKGASSLVLHQLGEFIRLPMFKASLVTGGWV